MRLSLRPALARRRTPPESSRLTCKKILRRRRTRGTGDQGLRGFQTRGSSEASKLCIL